eukprot:TCALIF_09873-PA protein Name:"Similar to Zdhhc11 Probable palmitoyltransferase ZDHHC11 (Mus musculus)" AED:0.13 eAED:0.13 QI:0/0/0/0.33/1/1/3/0/436
MMNCAIMSITGDIEPLPPKHPRKWRRVHGFQLPLHPQQVMAWGFLAFFIAFTFGILIPSLRSDAHLTLYIVFGVLYSLHLLFHTVSIVLDPADPNLRHREDHQPVPEFDRAKHNHVIENGRCHLCNITISSQRTKHCSVCNKCVSVFDHHCKWLNQCIGQRNYLPFFASVLTAIFMSVAYVGMTITVLVLYFWPRLDLLHPWEHLHLDPKLNNSSSDAQTATDIQFEMFTIPMPNDFFLAVTTGSVLLALFAFILLVHLCVFHMYINWSGITTYEYVREQRLQSDEQLRNESQSNEGKDTSIVMANRPRRPIWKCCQRATQVRPVSVSNYLENPPKRRRTALKGSAHRNEDQPKPNVIIAMSKGDKERQDDGVEYRHLRASPRLEDLDRLDTLKWTNQPSSVPKLPLGNRFHKIGDNQIKGKAAGIEILVLGFEET